MKKEKHYNTVNELYEPYKIINALDLGFNLGNVLKYVFRAGKKDQSKHIEDLQKAKDYIDYEIEKVKNATTKK